MTPEQIAQLIAEWRKAMKGVTPGEWLQVENVVGSKKHGTIAYSPVRYSSDPNYTHTEASAKTDAAWIARCSPVGIASLLTTIEDQAREIEVLRTAHIGIAHGIAEQTLALKAKPE